MLTSPERATLVDCGRSRLGTCEASRCWFILALRLPAHSQPPGRFSHLHKTWKISRWHPTRARLSMMMWLESVFVQIRAITSCEHWTCELNRQCSYLNALRVCPYYKCNFIDYQKFVHQYRWSATAMPKFVCSAIRADVNARNLECRIICWTWWPRARVHESTPVRG